MAEESTVSDDVAEDKDTAELEVTSEVMEAIVLEETSSLEDWY